MMTLCVVECEEQLSKWMKPSCVGCNELWDEICTVLWNTILNTTVSIDDVNIGYFGNLKLILIYWTSAPTITHLVL